MRKNKDNGILALGIVIIIILILSQKPNISQPRTATTNQPEFRNFYGISWRGAPCDNLAYAKAAGYDYVLYQTGMNNCPATDKTNMHFLIESPELGWTKSQVPDSIDITKAYTPDKIAIYNSLFTWKANATENTPFPQNLATGWWHSNISFRALPDFQQQKVIDKSINYTINTIKSLEDTSINWRFGGYAWDVPDLTGDWWNERQQSGYTGSYTCAGHPCRGVAVTLAFWNPAGTETGGIHSGITHEYQTYPEGYTAQRLKLYDETLKLYPDMKIVYEPYGVYDYIKEMNLRNDKIELMPTRSVLLCQESGDSLANDITFLTDQRIYDTSLITRDYACSSTPDTHETNTNLVIAGTAAKYGAWFTWFGRFGGTDGTTNYVSIREIPDRLKLIRLIPGWDNLNNIPLSSRSWDSANNIYKSNLSYADMNVIYSKHPKNDNIYAIILNSNGKIILKENPKEIYLTDQLMIKSATANGDFNINGQELTLKDSSNYGRMYIITTQTNTNQTVCTADAKQCPDGSYVGRIGPNCEFANCPNCTTRPTCLDENPPCLMAEPINGWCTTTITPTEKIDPIRWIKEQWSTQTGKIWITIITITLAYLLLRGRKK